MKIYSRRSPGARGPRTHRGAEARWLLAVIAGGTLVVLAATASGRANPDYLQAFKDRYPSSTLPEDMEFTLGVQCYVCHNPSQFFGDLNCYRRDIIQRLRAGRTIHQALADIETTDSDSDGVNNLSEILTPRFDGAGWGAPFPRIGFNPGLVGQTGADPCYSDPAQPQSFRPETPGTPCGQADIADTAGTPGPDGSVDNGDFALFFTEFFAASCSICPNTAGLPCNPADIADTAGAPGPDGCVDNGDFSLFFTAFFAGCP